MTRFIDDAEQAALKAGVQLSHVFSTAGHEQAQAMVAVNIDHCGDGVFSYYRSKCVWFAVGMTPKEYIASAFQIPGSYANRRNASVLPFHRSIGGATIAPVNGGVGSQFEPSLGWARAIKMGANIPQGALAFVFAGDGAVSTGGFWSAIREAATYNLPLVIVIENNGVALSTPANCQFPGDRISDSLQSFPNLSAHWFDGSNTEAFAHVQAIIESTRTNRRPVLIEFSVKRQSGHSGADKSEGFQVSQDNLFETLQEFANTNLGWSRQQFEEIVSAVQSEVTQEFGEAERQSSVKVDTFVFESDLARQTNIKRPFQLEHPFGSNRVSIGHAINCWLRNALAQSHDIVLLGEDIGRMGGAHGVTRGLQSEFGSERVIDSSLNEGCILGQAVGMALQSYRPIVEIQFRRYLAPAMEQFHNIGQCEWLTSGAFRMPIILRIPFGTTAKNDPWHSESGEAELLCATGYDVACPSSSQDAIDMLDTAYVNEKPTVLLEHRDLYYSSFSRQTLTSSATIEDAYGARVLRNGSDVTIVSWGKFVRISKELADEIVDVDCEVIDLRWLKPWDTQTVFDSIRKTKRCLVAHEDRRFMGFGAEVSATISEQMFGTLVVPVLRLGAADNPIPVGKELVDAVIPTKEKLREAIERMMRTFR